MGEVLMVNVKEAARRLAMGRSATYSLLTRRELRSVKVGGSRRILVSDLEEFVRALSDDGEATDDGEGGTA